MDCDMLIADPLFNLFMWAQWHFLNVYFHGRDKHLEYQITHNMMRDYKIVDSAPEFQAGSAKRLLSSM